MSTDEKLDELLVKVSRLERIAPLVEALIGKKTTLSERAKMAGCSASTQWRKEKRVRLQRLAGISP